MSNWDGDSYSSSYNITITRDDFENRRYSVQRNPESGSEDWNNLIDVKTIRITAEYDRALKFFSEDSRIDRGEQEIHRIAEATALKEVPCLKPEVIDWLEAFIPDAPNPGYNNCTKAWCMGNDEYRSGGRFGEFSLWFYRKRDAMEFVKFWSVHKKCTTYFDYFNETRKELINGKLTKIDY